MIFLAGPVFHDDDLLNMPDSNNPDILIIDQNKLNLSLQEFSNRITQFASEHESVSIVPILHGAETLKGHDSSFNLSNDYWFPRATEGWRPWYPSAIINSEDLLQTITDAVGNKLKDIWYYSCQNSKIINDAQSILPHGSTLFTTGPGFFLDYKFLNDILPKWIESNQTDLTAEGFMTYYINSLTHYEDCPLPIQTEEDESENESENVDPCYRLHKGGYNFNPVKTIIGEKTIKLVEKAENFLQKLSENAIPESTQQKILQYISENSVFHDQISLEALKGKHIEACPTEVGKGNYFVEWITGNEVDDTPQNEGCTLTQQEYFLALAAANAYEHIIHNLPGQNIQ